MPVATVLGGAGYLAMVPLAGGLGQLWRSAGLRRWMGASDAVRPSPSLLADVPSSYRGSTIHSGSSSEYRRLSRHARFVKT